ncbi:MAG: NADH-quinone oxidoreductase subunit L [Phycisphaerales bacterium]
MLHAISNLPALLALAASEPAASVAGAPTDGNPLWLLIPGLPMLAVVLVGLCAIARVKSKLPAFLTVACLAVAFALTLQMYSATVAAASGPNPHAFVVKAWDWFDFAWSTDSKAHHFIANFSFYIDTLTCLWMLFVTGLATLIALYASEYMSHDVGPGYCRFFAAFSLFVFSMASLVMGDNLLMLYLGWEGVGLCSYLLIGYFYKKPSAVAAAKKAFIMNRIGDLGLAVGIMLTFVQFGTVEYATLFDLIEKSGYLTLAAEGKFDQIPFLVQLIPVLFTVGAFGKSAQLPLYVWLPDAMEGPTPVSALIHAATMVTAGVYLVIRFFPFYQCSEWAPGIVAWVGALTALFSATIAMAQFDIKRIMAYSTVSQLGYMFAGAGVAGTGAAAFHVFTHAFFKATLFLACGAVMHGFAGQLDLRKLSGVMKMKGWLIVGLAMLVGCLNLSGFPFTAGFFSKDMIISDALANHHFQAVGVILLLAAGLTAYYTFRVFFRVFVGPQHYEPGDELHGADDHGHGHDDHGHDAKTSDKAHDPAHGHPPGDFHPHPPGWAINFVLAALAVASILAAGVGFMHLPGHAGHAEGGWVVDLVDASSGKVYQAHAGHAHATILGIDPHNTKIAGVGAMYVISSFVGFIGIAVAFFLHYAGRTTAATSRADSLLPAMGPIARWARHKWYVDELYNWLFVRPLWVLAKIFHWIDVWIVDGLVNTFGAAPSAAGSGLRPAQSGILNGYAAGMAAGVGLVVLLALLLMR